MNQSGSDISLSLQYKRTLKRAQSGAMSRFYSYCAFNIFTGRNEVLAKVIFARASVIHSVHREGCSRFCSNFSGGGGIFGGNSSKFLIKSSSKFSGGVPPNFFLGGYFFGGGSPNFRGGVFFGGVLHRNTVNVWPVRILLECILVKR